MPTNLAPVRAVKGRDASDDPLMSFEAESDIAFPPSTVDGPPAASEEPALARSKRPVLIGLLTIVAIALVGALMVVFQTTPKPAAAAAVPAAAARATVTFTSEPAGATVTIDSVVQGVTPLKLPIAAGQHTLEVSLGPTKRAQALSVDAGAIMAQHYDFGAAATTQNGRLEISSDPAGARVSVDGTPRGVTPLSLPSIAVGEHRVTLSTDQSSIQRQVTVAAGATATVMATIANAAAAGGWATIKSPIELQVFEGGQLIATTSTPRFMLPAGRHDLEVTNPELEFRAPLRVEIEAGKTAAASVSIPNGSLSVNALPWAEVIIDGKAAGPTPIGNLSIPIGSHEIVWRHPQLGERKRVVSVAARTPVRVGMDFSK
jgi:PEGA domain-containing protein